MHNKVREHINYNKASKTKIVIGSIVLGLLAFGIPELCMLIALCIVGKQGYEFLKQKLSKYLKPFARKGLVSQTRYQVGLFMFCVPIIFGILNPYLAHYFSLFKNIALWSIITLDSIFILSFFVLGGDFWDKLHRLFNHQLKFSKT